MYQGETKIRVRYGETDQMGYVYYGRYAEYFEVGRTEVFREMGMNYKKFEDQGIMLPVLEMKIRYMSPARYDDLLTIVTRLEQMPSARIRFVYDTYNEARVHLNTGEVTLVFTDSATRRPIRPPEQMIRKLDPYFN